MRESNSTPWLTDAVWAAATRLGAPRVRRARRRTVEDDHLEFLEAGVPSVDIIDLDYPAWHRADDTLDKLSAALAADRRRRGRRGARRTSRRSAASDSRRLIETRPLRSSVPEGGSSSSGSRPQQHRCRRLGLREDPIHTVVGHRHPALLQPEHDVRLA